MSQASLDYINAQITNREHVNTGEIVTTSKLTLSNGFVVNGSSVRDINGYDMAEAQKSADDSAIASLIPGVDYLLANKE